MKRYKVAGLEMEQAPESVPYNYDGNDPGYDYPDYNMDDYHREDHRHSGSKRSRPDDYEHEYEEEVRVPSRVRSAELRGLKAVQEAYFHLYERTPNTIEEALYDAVGAIDELVRFRDGGDDEPENDRSWELNLANQKIVNLSAVNSRLVVRIEQLEASEQSLKTELNEYRGLLTGNASSSGADTELARIQRLTEELESARARHKKEVESIRAAHSKEVESVREVHAKEVESIREESDVVQKELELARTKGTYAAGKIAALKSQVALLENDKVKLVADARSNQRAGASVGNVGLSRERRAIAEHVHVIEGRLLEVKSSLQRMAGVDIKKEESTLVKAEGARPSGTGAGPMDVIELDD